MSAAQPDPTTRRSFLGLAAVGVLGMTLVGCGSDDGGAATTAPATSAAEPEEPTTEAAAPTTTEADGDTVAVSMKDIQFVPKVVTVKVGQTVVWTNTESIQHDVRALKGAKFQSALFGEGGTYEFTPKTAGTVEYDCSVHPGMVGTLNVEA